MRYVPRLAFGSWGQDPTLDQARLVAALEGLVRVNETILRRVPNVPRLYASGVRYAPPAVLCRAESDACTAEGDDPWADLLDVLSLGVGDCEDLAAWRAAELRVFDRIAATCDVVLVGRGRVADEMHVIVRLPNGRTEDPSRALGMR